MATLRRADAATLARIAKNERATAAALIRAEKATTLALDGAIRSHTVQLAGALAGYDDPSADDVHAEVHRTHHALEAALIAAIFLGRRHARAAGRAVLATTLGLDAIHAFASSQASDPLRAKAYGSSLSTQWTTLVLALAAASMSDPSKGVKTAPVRMKSRTVRTAATESADAFNTERAQAVAAVNAASASPSLVSPIAIAQSGNGVDGIWSAFLDRRTCAECWRRNGTYIGPRDPHPPIHTLCRCIVVYVRRP